MEVMRVATVYLRDFPEDLHRKAKVKAAMTDVPIAQAVREFLERWVEDDFLSTKEKH